MQKPSRLLAALLILVAMSSRSFAWDHPGHMLTADVAFSEIERMRPELIDTIGRLFLAHPEAGPLWVAVGEAKGKERVRRMFIECARWRDRVEH